MQVADDDGMIETGGKPLNKYVSFVQGATQGDRNSLRVHVPKLIAAGWVTEAEPGLWKIRDWSVIQSSDYRQGSVRLSQSVGKSAKSFSSRSQIREEKNFNSDPRHKTVKGVPCKPPAPLSELLPNCFGSVKDKK